MDHFKNGQASIPFTSGPAHKGFTSPSAVCISVELQAETTTNALDNLQSRSIDGLCLDISQVLPFKSAPEGPLARSLVLI